MSCYHPLKGFRTPSGVVFSELGRHDILGDIEIPCGQCIGCRMRRASDWTLRVMHEASLWPENCFVTLTYGRDKLPPDGGLEHRDFQLFMKRVRKHFGKTVRYYMCGEYGPLNFRPHFHACLFNVDFQSDRVQAGKSGSGAVFYDSPTLSRLWSHGRVSVQDLTRETAGYCARYIMKKRLGQLSEADMAAYVTDDGVIRRREYAAMSLKPGIGAGWYEKFGVCDVHRHDFVIADGSKLPVPKYYDKLFKRTGNVKFDAIEFEREKRAKLSAADQTDERRAVREVVHLARVRNLLRGDCDDASE